MSTFCLDSWAVLAWLEDLPRAAERVEAALRSGSTVMSWVNIGEVFYVVARRRGRSEARAVVAALQGLLDAEAPTPTRVMEAAGIKAEHPIAYADAFAVATALAHDAVLLTGDPELLEGPSEWRVEDLRS